MNARILGMKSERVFTTGFSIFSFHKRVRPFSLTIVGPFPETQIASAQIFPAIFLDTFSSVEIHSRAKKYFPAGRKTSRSKARTSPFSAITETLRAEVPMSTQSTFFMLKNIADFQKTYSDPKRPKRQKSILRLRNFI